MRSRMVMAGAVALALGGMSQLAIGTTISVNFVGGQGGGAGAGTVTGPAGINLAPNWNNATGASGSLPNAINSNGDVAASVSWTSPNLWAATNAAPAGGGSATMMNGYLDNFNNNTATVSGLSNEFTGRSYDVVVYFSADGTGQSTQGFNVNDGIKSSTAYGHRVNGLVSNFPLAGTNGFITSTQTLSNTTFPSNAVLLTGFTNDSFTITGVNGTLGDGRSRPTGFQVLSTKPTGQLIVPQAGSDLVSGQAFIEDGFGNPTNLPVSWKIEQYNTQAGLKTEWYANAGVDTITNVNNFLAGNPAPSVTFQSDQVAFGGPVGFPTEVTDLGLQGSGNRVVRYTGQIFIPESGTYRFKDGVDQSTQLSIGGQTIISDNNWTEFNGAGGQGGTNATANFSVAEGGEWLDFSFIMGEVCCGNHAALYWDYDETLGVGGNAAFPAVGTDGAGLGALVGEEFFRSIDLLATYTGTNPINGLFIDDLGNTILFDADTQALRLTVEGEGRIFTTTALTFIPEPGTIALLGLGAVGLLRRRRVA